MFFALFLSRKHVRIDRSFFCLVVVVKVFSLSTVVAVYCQSNLQARRLSLSLFFLCVEANECNINKECAFVLPTKRESQKRIVQHTSRSALGRDKKRPFGIPTVKNHFTILLFSGNVEHLHLKSHSGKFVLHYYCIRKLRRSIVHFNQYHRTSPDVL